MNCERLYRLLESGGATSISLAQIAGVIKKADPAWQLITGGSITGYGCTIEIPNVSIPLDFVVAALSESMISPENPHGGYARYAWQVCVAEGEALRAGYRDDLRHQITPVKNLFDTVESEYKKQTLLKGEPSAKRTAAAIDLYLR